MKKSMWRIYIKHGNMIKTSLNYAVQYSVTVEGKRAKIIHIFGRQQVVMVSRRSGVEYMLRL